MHIQCIILLKPGYGTDMMAYGTSGHCMVKKIKVINKLENCEVKTKCKLMFICHMLSGIN